MNSLIAEHLIEAIKDIVSPPCPLHEPLFIGNESKYVHECISSGWVSTVGSFVDRFEEMLCEFTGSDFAVATVNGTSALHVALLLAGVSEDCEVFMPSLSFVATANAVAYCGAIPHFIDIERTNLGLDPSVLSAHLEQNFARTGSHWINKATGRRAGAIVPVHAFGHPCDIEAICEVGKTFGIPIVEDAAESLGSYYKDRHTGTFGESGILSFNGNKVVTCGAGGAILTQDEELQKRAKHLTTTAKQPHPWEYFHDQIGFNYRMPNLNAALGCAQLESLPEFLERKRTLFQKYKATLTKLEDIQLVEEPEHCRSNYWLQTIILKSEEASNSRDSVLHQLNQQGILARPAWIPLNQLPMYSSCPSTTLDVTNAIVPRLINLPSGPKLMQEEYA